jgi:hypothetical protein
MSFFVHIQLMWRVLFYSVACNSPDVNDLFNKKYQYLLLAFGMVEKRAEGLQSREL